MILAKTILAILTVFSLVPIGAQDSPIPITVDTIGVKTEGYLSNVALLEGKFYCMYDTDRQHTDRDFKKMVVVGVQGEFIEDVFVPEGIQDMPYYDLIVENDRLYAKESQFERENYVLGKYDADFELVKRKEFTVFQDSSFDVYTRCNGEWGATVFFQDRKTKNVYEVSSPCVTAINKLDNAYYITGASAYEMGSVVLRINNPYELTKTKLTLDRYRGSRHAQGRETLFKKPFSSAPTHIHTSFVSGGRLLHLYSDSSGTRIGELTGGNLYPLYTFENKFTASIRQQYRDEKQLLTCWFPDTKKQAILLIEKKGFSFYFLR